MYSLQIEDAAKWWSSPFPEGWSTGRSPPAATPPFGWNSAGHTPFAISCRHVPRGAPSCSHHGQLGPAWLGSGAPPPSKVRTEQRLHVRHSEAVNRGGVQGSVSLCRRPRLPVPPTNRGELQDWLASSFLGPPFRRGRGECSSLHEGQHWRWFSFLLTGYFCVSWLFGIWNSFM